MSSHSQDLWRGDFFSLRASLDDYIQPFSHTCLYELTHAIVHIAISYNRRSLVDRESDLKDACNHVRRAHLDYLKILVRKIHTKLQGAPNIGEFLSFQRDHISARQIELTEIGGLPTGTIERFKAIIDKYKGILPQRRVEPKPDDAEYLAGRTRPEEKLSAATLETMRLPAKDARASLWEWARLESTLTAVRGKKVCDFSYRLADSFIKFSCLAEELKEQIAKLKICVMGAALSMDNDNTLELALSDLPSYNKIIKPTIDMWIDPGQVVSGPIPQSVIVATDESFKIVEKFLGL